MPQPQAESRERSARLRAAQVLGAEPETFQNPLTVLASPAWRGIEGDVWRASANGRSIILKHYHPDTRFYVDTAAAFEGAAQAGKLGAGPEILDQSPSEQMLAMEDLGSPWRAGGLHDMADPVIRNKVIVLRKSYQGGAALSRTTSIFAEIDALLRDARQQGCATHRDIAVFADFFDEARQKLQAEGMDSVPCHRDGNAANLMIGPDNAVKLLDFDLAANCDPFEDIGCHLVEVYESDTDARGGFEEWYGRFDEGLFQRAMIYGMADDMRWGLIGSIMGASSPRSALEFSKYAAWRFLRLEAKAKSSDANNRLRAAK
ncbi:phosphotransferase [Oceanibium sediminis]|uniref:phosphotransferase n=1 Tax=Oceanibium sediminis TaxID=2026339 RepID=UPI000DD3A96C|nr:phosphotransferase [Oceanibium sediminis]